MAKGRLVRKGHSRWTHSFGSPSLASYLPSGHLLLQLAAQQPGPRGLQGPARSAAARPVPSCHPEVSALGRGWSEALAVVVTTSGQG